MTNLVYLSDVAPYEGGGTKQPAGVHRSLEAAGRALEEVASLNGLGFRDIKRVSDLDEATLAGAAVLALFTIGETAWLHRQREEVEARVGSGDLGLVGLHSATDSAYSWPNFGELIGARFAGHPVTARLPVSVVDSAHPATAHLPSPWYFKEELYLFGELAKDAKVLLGVHGEQLEPGAFGAVSEHLARLGTAGVPGLLPMAWCIERGNMRSFYTVLGHFLEAYEDVRYMQHLNGAVEWVLAGRAVARQV